MLELLTFFFKKTILDKQEHFFFFPHFAKLWHHSNMIGQL